MGENEAEIEFVLIKKENDGLSYVRRQSLRSFRMHLW